MVTFIIHILLPLRCHADVSSVPLGRFINVTVYYGITLNTADLAGNRHVNLFLSGLVEIPAYTLPFFIVSKSVTTFSLLFLLFQILNGKLTNR